MVRMFCIVLLACLLAACPASAERTVYADQGGVSVFVEDGRAGLVDASGNVVLDADYEWIEPFNGGDFAVVHRDASYGIVRRDGTVLVPCEAQRIYVFTLSGRVFADVEFEDGKGNRFMDFSTGEVLLAKDGAEFKYLDSYIAAANIVGPGPEYDPADWGC